MEEQKTSGRGGARPGAGRPRADELPPDHRCTYEKPDGDRCGNAAVAGTPSQVCWHHGGRSTAALAKKQEAVDRALALVSVEPVSVADFPTVAAEYVARFNLRFARLDTALELKRAELDADDIEVVRLYSDIIAEQKSTALVVVRLMEAAAKLGIAASSQQVADALHSVEFARMLPVLMDALAPYPDARLAVASALGGPVPGELVEAGEGELSGPEADAADPEPADRGSATEIEDGWDLL